MQKIFNLSKKNRILAFQQDYDLSKITVEALRSEKSFGEVYRLRSRQSEEQFGGNSTAILKITPTSNGTDQNMGDREVRFYQKVLPNFNLNKPEVYLVDQDSDQQAQILLLEDLGPRYKFPPRAHRWTHDEIQSPLRTYASLHEQGLTILEYQLDNSWMFSYHREIWQAEDLIQKYEFLVNTRNWPMSAGIIELIEKTYLDRPFLNEIHPTILHHDSWQSNIGLPRNNARNCALVDWGFGGYGACEFDLTYLFLEPFEGGLGLSMRELVHSYWEERRKISGISPDKNVQWDRFSLVIRTQALAILHVAYDIAINPYPAGSFAAFSWERFNQVLPQRLDLLSKF